MVSNGIKLLALTAGVLSIGAVAIATVSHDSITFASGNQSYSCGSIHFGMKDSDCSAMTYDCSTSSSNLSSNYTLSNVTVSISATNTYVGGTYTSSDASYSGYPIRIGKSKALGTVTLTFGQQIIGCTVYALQYTNDPVTMVVNGQETTLSNSVASRNKAAADVEVFDPYQFTFDATNTLTLTAKQASKTVNGKSVSASRYYVADIALRIAL